MNNYLCKCYQCKNVFIDPDPSENSYKFDIDMTTQGYKELLKEDGKMKDYWICPNCLTDEFLVEIIKVDLQGNEDR